MISRLVRAGALAVPLLVPLSALAQDVTIDHQAVECIVVGKFPKMNACFAPVSGVGKARVYFRPETLTTWFYVEMAADASCHSGVLPKPTKALIDKKIFYYLDVQGGGTARTPEFAPVVVAREEDCKNMPAAPVAATGPAGVYPSLPAGFASGISAAVVAGGVAAAVVVTGGALALAGDDETPGTPGTPPTVPVTSPPVTGPPPTGPPATAPPSLPPLVVACEATPRSGEAPLRVQFATFPSGGTGTYEFLWTFGDGEFSPNPNPAHTFLTDGVFNATVRVVSGDQTATCSRPILVGPLPSPPPPSPSTPPSPISFKLQVVVVGSGTGVVTSVPAGINCPGDCDETYPPGTVVTLTATPAGAPPTVFTGWTGHCTGTGPCVVTMVSNRNVVAHFERAWTLTVTGGGPNSDIAGGVTSNPAGITCAWLPSQPPCVDTGTFVNGTSVVLTVSTGGATVVWGGACPNVNTTTCTVFVDANKAVTIDTRILFQRSTQKPEVPLAWSSQLEVPDGEGQVVTNGRIASAVRPGISAMAANGRTGSNHVEAVLVSGAGRPGTWRFDFSRQAGFRPGSLRVLAGTVSVITGNTVIFRLQGKPGERLAFTFEIDP